MAKIDKKALREVRHAEKSRIAIKNMGYKDSAPPVVTLMGPASSGKSTLLESIVSQHFKKSKCNGLVTMKAKNRRYTFYECPADIDHTIDAVKISDMIIFVVNLRAGLQKDTLEAISMMNSFGVPKFCFALTNHTDESVTNKAVKAVETRIQKEFAFPVKFFCLKQDVSGTYENIRSMARYLETMKFRPVEWKCTHPYIVVDRYKGGMGYGYVRGGPIANELDAHIPGVGDVKICGIEASDDPLEAKGNVLYGVAHEESDTEEPSSAESLFLEIDDVKLFDGVDSASSDGSDLSATSTPGGSSPNVTDIHDINNNMHAMDNDIHATDSNRSIPESKSTRQPRSLDTLREDIRHRFRAPVTDEEELAEKFHEDTKHKSNPRPANILQEMKARELQNERELVDNQRLLVPGTYVRFKLEAACDQNSLVIVGSYLPTEGSNILLRGKVAKNKWQTFDLKSNAPYFFSVGWCRFQSIPVFCKGDLFSKYCKEFSEIQFYGPSVPLGSSFFIYSYDADYRILGSGQVLNISGCNSVRKKLKLIGHPQRLIGQSVIIQSMFSSSREASRFLHARLKTASGLRGLLKGTAGSDGCVRAVFEGSVLMSEIIFLRCFVPVQPYMYLQHVVPGGRYVAHLKELREAADEASAAESSTGSVYEDEDRKARENRDDLEIKMLEKQLPVEKRQRKVVVERIDLPLPPEMRRQAREKAEIERRRQESDERAKATYMAGQEKKKQAHRKMLDLKSEMRRKNAIETSLQKKRHKKSKKRC